MKIKTPETAIDQFKLDFLAFNKRVTSTLGFPTMTAAVLYYDSINDGYSLLMGEIPPIKDSKIGLITNINLSIVSLITKVIMNGHAPICAGFSSPSFMASDDDKERVEELSKLASDQDVGKISNLSTPPDAFCISVSTRTDSFGMVQAFKNAGSQTEPNIEYTVSVDVSDNSLIINEGELTYPALLVDVSTLSSKVEGEKNNKVENNDYTPNFPDKPPFED